MSSTLGKVPGPSLSTTAGRHPNQPQLISRRLPDRQNFSTLHNAFQVPGHAGGACTHSSTPHRQLTIRPDGHGLQRRTDYADCSVRWIGASLLANRARRWNRTMIEISAWRVSCPRPSTLVNCWCNSSHSASASRQWRRHLGIDGRCHADLLEENGKPRHLAFHETTPITSPSMMPRQPRTCLILLWTTHRHRRCTTQALVATRLHWVALVEQSAMQRSRFGSTTKNRARHAATHDSCLSPQSAAPTQAAQLFTDG